MCCAADEADGAVLCEVIHGKTSTHAVISPLESRALTRLCFSERWASEKKRDGKELVAQKAMLSLRCSFLLSSDLIRITGLRNAVDGRRRVDRKWGVERGDRREAWRDSSVHKSSCCTHVRLSPDLLWNQTSMHWYYFVSLKIALGHTKNIGTHLFFENLLFPKMVGGP